MDDVTARVKSPLKTPEGDHAIGALITLPEDQAEELSALGVVEIMPEMPAEGGKKKSAPEKAGK
jgi:hypothetical protein